MNEPYRLISEFKEVKAIAQQYDAYATVISGAGPTILTMSLRRSGIVRALRKAVTTCHSELATINEIGVVEEIVYPS